MRQPQQSLGASRQHLNLGHVVQPQSPLATCTPEIDDGKQDVWEQIYWKTHTDWRDAGGFYCKLQRVTG